ncbi:hypothetical protein CASFOL_035065 [Castilleja foliolosa]|uniref:Uncharacterized protein n=1 Tax=Castilleja foliolosa TaxID=1961234 RepID=A0ABD3BRS3_9LAMI
MNVRSFGKLLPLQFLQACGTILNWVCDDCVCGPSWGG